jgi:predicted nucleotidyltransferase
MPVRSLNSPVLIWPDAESVDLAARRWAEHASQNPEVVRIGYFGSYARGDWGPGSDLDLLIIVKQAEELFERRAIRWDTTDLPVPAEALVYTAREWESVAARSKFGRTVSREVVWIYESQ